MNQINDSVLRIIRSYQTFGELHITRCVCKRWIYVETISKSLDGEIHPYIPPTACFKNTQYLYIPLDNRYYLNLLLRVLEESKNSLKSLDIHMGSSFPDFINLSSYPIPFLYALEELALIEFNRDQYKLICSKAPNITKLNLTTESGTDTFGSFLD